MILEIDGKEVDIFSQDELDDLKNNWPPDIEGMVEKLILTSSTLGDMLLNHIDRKHKVLKPVSSYSFEANKN